MKMEESVLNRIDKVFEDILKKNRSVNIKDEEFVAAFIYSLKMNNGMFPSEILKVEKKNKKDLKKMDTTSMIIEVLKYVLRCKIIFDNMNVEKKREEENKYSFLAENISLTKDFPTQEKMDQLIRFFLTERYTPSSKYAKPISDTKELFYITAEETRRIDCMYEFENCQEFAGKHR